jgi:hypothetical protein
MNPELVFLVLQVPIDSQACSRDSGESGPLGPFLIGIMELYFSTQNGGDLRAFLLGLLFLSMGIPGLYFAIKYPELYLQEKEHTQNDRPKNLVQKIMKDLDGGKPPRITFSPNIHMTKNNTKKKKKDEQYPGRYETQTVPTGRFPEPPPHCEHPDIPSSFGPAAKNMPNWTKE